MSLLDQLFGITTIYKDGANPYSRSAMNFTGTVTVTDDAANGWVEVAIGSGIVTTPADPADDGQLVYADSGTYVLTDTVVVHETGGVVDGFTAVGATTDMVLQGGRDVVFNTNGGTTRAVLDETSGTGFRVYNPADATQFGMLEYDEILFNGPNTVDVGFRLGTHPSGAGQDLRIWGQTAFAASGAAGGDVLTYTGAGDGAGADGVFDVYVGGSGGAREFRVGDGYVGLGSGTLATGGTLRTEADFSLESYIAAGTNHRNVISVDSATNILEVGEVPAAGAPVQTIRLAAAGNVEVWNTATGSQKATISPIVYAFSGGAACYVSAGVHPDASGNTFTISGMQAAVAGGGNGGDLVILPGLADGAGTDGSTELQDAGGNVVVEVTSTSKLGLFGASPVVQQTDPGALTDSTGGTPSATLSASVGTDPAAYAGIYVDANSTATTIGASTPTKYQITVFGSNSAYNDATPDHTNDHITIGTTGDYLITCSISAEAAGTDTFRFLIYKNNGATLLNGLRCNRLMPINDVGSMSISGIASLTAGDTVELWVINMTGTNNVTVTDVNLALHRLDQGGVDPDVLDDNFASLAAQSNATRLAQVNVGLTA